MTWSLDLEKRSGWVALALFAAALLLRLPAATFDSLWLDELYTVRLIEGDFGTTVERAVRDNHPPLPTLIYDLAASIFGLDDATLRTTAALFGALGVPLLWLLFHRPYGPWAAMLASLATLVSPFHIHHSRDVRPYGMAFVVALLLLWGAVRLASHPTRRRAVAFGLLAALAMYTHYAFATVLLGLCTTIAILADAPRLRSIRRLAEATAVALVAYLPWIGPMLADAGKTSTWVPAPDGGALATVLAALLSEESGLILLFGGGVISFALSLRSKASADERGADLLLLGASLLPLAFAFFKSSVPDTPSLFNKQMMMLMAPPLLLAWGRGIAGLATVPVTRTKISLVVLSTWVLIALGALLRIDPYTTRQKPDNRGAATWIAEQVDPETRHSIFFSDYHPGYIDHYLRLYGLSANAAWSQASDRPRLHRLLLEVARAGQPRDVFLIAAQRPVDEGLVTLLTDASVRHRRHTLHRVTVHAFRITPVSARAGSPAVDALVHAVAGWERATPVGRGDFDVRRLDTLVLYRANTCTARERAAPFFLNVWQTTAGDGASFVSTTGRFTERGVVFGGACYVTLKLPPGGVDRLATGQLDEHTGEARWRVTG